MEKPSQYLTPFQRKLLLKSLQTDLRAEYYRRIKIMLLADEGQSQARICEELGCSQEMARHWMVMAQTGQAHRWNERSMGRPKTVNEQYLDHLKELISNSPCDYGYSESEKAIKFFAPIISACAPISFASLSCVFVTSIEVLKLPCVIVSWSNVRSSKMKKSSS